jgi:hypothetical protein
VQGTVARQIYLGSHRDYLVTLSDGETVRAVAPSTVSIPPAKALAAPAAGALPGAGELAPRRRSFSRLHPQHHLNEEHRVSITPQQAPEHLTRYVSEFICSTRLEDLPQDVVALGKKSILDGLGLALSAAPATAVRWCAGTSPSSTSARVRRR